MKRVLLVSAVFPPQLGGPSVIVTKRAKYFYQLGWQTVVLAPNIPANSPRDETLLAEIENLDVEVHRTGYLFQSRMPSLHYSKGHRSQVEQKSPSGLRDLLFVPRGYVRWMPFAISRGAKLARSVDVVLSMSNPITMHLVGLAVSRLSRKPWVAEVLDPIVGYAYARRGPQRLNRFLESLVVHTANHIIQRQGGAPGEISDRYPRIPSAKFTVIPFFGYDPEDFAQPSVGCLDDDVLKITYTGSFYGTTITPLSFLQALRRVLSETPKLATTLRVSFAGDWDSKYTQVVEELGLHDTVKYVGHLCRKECIQLWLSSDVLLLILGPEEDNRLRIPTKFWEYVGARRSILALVHPRGRAAQFVREQQLGFVADTENIDEIAAALRDVIGAHQRGCLKPQPSPGFLALADRARGEKMVVDVLNRTIGKEKHDL